MVLRRYLIIIVISLKTFFGTVKSRKRVSRAPINRTNTNGIVSRTLRIYHDYLFSNKRFVSETVNGCVHVTVVQVGFYE